jgi:hypothetical protein
MRQRLPLVERLGVKPDPELGSWSGLVVGERFKCGHAKTPANTYIREQSRKQGGVTKSKMCLTCKRGYSREYFHGRSESLDDNDAKA